MGSDAALYYFDITAYRDHVVPGLRALMAGKMPPRWLLNLVDTYDYHGMEKKLAATFTPYPVDLAMHCTYLDEDLACVDPGRFNANLGTRPRAVAHLQLHNPDARRCAASACPARANCPFYIENNTARAELINTLFEHAVSWVCCQSEGVFVGRSSTPSHFESAMEMLNVPAEAPLRQWLDDLGTRGFIIGYGWANGDGVHGWLDAEECEDLAVALCTLNLPAYPTTPENLVQYTPLKARMTPWIEQYGWERIVLAYLRAMAEDAAARNVGLLWANDLVTDACKTFGDFDTWRGVYG